MRYATCARPGNAYFTHRLRSARPSSAAFLLLSQERLDAACGACSIVPDPFTGFVLVTATDASGHAEIVTRIPNSWPLVGLTLLEQWLVVDPSSPGCSQLGTDVSTALSVEIQ